MEVPREDEPQDEKEDLFKNYLDSLGSVKVEDFKEFIKAALGNHFNDESTKEVFDAINTRPDGLIDVRGFMEAFGANMKLTQDQQKELYKTFLRGVPAPIAGMSNWGAALSKVGLNLNEDEIEAVIMRARKSAMELLAYQLEEMGLDPRKIEEEALLEMSRQDEDGSCDEMSSDSDWEYNHYVPLGKK